MYDDVLVFQLDAIILGSTDFVQDQWNQFKLFSRQVLACPEKQRLWSLSQTIPVTKKAVT